MLPLIVVKRRGMDRTHAGKFLLYFIGLGIGFIVIEIAIMQRFILFLGHPMYSLTVTLFSILIFSGVGAFISGRWFYAPGPHAFLIPISIGALVLIFHLTSGSILATIVDMSLWARIAVTTLMLAPMGLVLGMPFAYGIHLVDQFNPSFVPWAWAVNGCFTVIGSVLTVILSMNFGFSITMGLAVLIYFIAFAAMSRLPAAQSA